MPKRPLSTTPDEHARYWKDPQVAQLGKVPRSVSSCTAYTLHANTDELRVRPNSLTIRTGTEMRRGAARQLAREGFWIGTSRCQSTACQTQHTATNEAFCGVPSLGLLARTYSPASRSPFRITTAALWGTHPERKPCVPPQIGGKTTRTRNPMLRRGCGRPRNRRFARSEKNILRAPRSVEETPLRVQKSLNYSKRSDLSSTLPEVGRLVLGTHTAVLHNPVFTLCVDTATIVTGLSLLTPFLNLVPVTPEGGR